MNLLNPKTPTSYRNFLRRPPLLLVRSFLIAVALLLLATVVLQRFEHRVSIWTVTSDLAAGTPLRGSDLAQVSVTLNESARRYLSAHVDPIDWIALQDLHEGELLSSRSVQKDDAKVVRRIVSVNVEEHHLPAHLARGSKVDLYVTPIGVQNEILGAPECVAEALVVMSVDTQGLRSGVTLSVIDNQVSAIVEASQRGHLDIVGYHE